MKISAEKLCEIIGVPFVGNEEMRATQVSIPLTDSRSLTRCAETVFFAIRTETGDGHNYIGDMYAKGVRVFVCDLSRVGSPAADAVWIDTPDPLAALAAVAAYIRSLLACPVIGITGSVGKTVVKEMLNAAIAPWLNVARSPRSWNSQVGVPMSLWQVRPDTQVAVFEAGISRPGEMESLQKIIKPEIGVFTVLTDEHDRGFASRREKMEQKALLFKDCRSIYYIGGDALVEDVLKVSCPQASLHPCDDYRSLCRAVAAEVGVELPADVKLPEYSSRIDIYDSPEGLMAAMDRCSCDLTTIATGLDVLRRRRPEGMSLSAVLGDPICRPDDEEDVCARLAELLRDYGVTSLVTAGPMLERHASLFHSGITVRSFATPAEVTARLDAGSFFNHALYINGTDKPAFAAIYSWLAARRNVTRLEISLDALTHNYRHYRSLLPPQTGIIGMVKADAYGCGSLEVARTLQDAGADMVAVAVVDEGVALRNGGVSLPVMVLDPWCENMQAIFACRLQPTLIGLDEQLLVMLEDAATAQGVDTIEVHVKLDTGMHRVGLSEDELEAFAEMMARHPRFRAVTTFSHLATADCPDLEDYTQGQLDRFARMSERLQQLLGYRVRRHLLNTAGISRFGKSTVYDLARLGIGLYGISPLDEADRAALRPVARLVTRIIARRSYDANTSIGYGCHGRTYRPSVIGTIPIGYADGIDRRLGNGGMSVLVNGKLCPTIGNICMDLCMIDITDCPDIGDGTVEIFGPAAPIERLSTTLGTIPYEIIARISPRVKRVYFRD